MKKNFITRNLEAWRRTICLSCFVCMFALSAYGQQRVSGTVTDASGEPVTGASIIEKGVSANGTITGADGSFVLDVKPDATLTVSCIGFATQDVAVGSRSQLKIALLEDAQALDEVVVVGYGTQRKIDLAGSVVRANLSTLRESPNISLMSGLQGTVPGLNVGAVTQAGSSPAVTIRGRNSISGSLNPLIVLDGIIFNGNIVDINPNDIESVDILKDASSAAVYGVQSANGVILITSRQGKVMSKPIVSYSASYSVQRAAKPYDLMNSSEFLQLLADCNIEESRVLGSNNEPLPQMKPDFDYANYMAGATTRQGYQDGVNNDWLGMFSDSNPHIQQHDISVRGRSDLVGYFFSAGYLDQQNLIINDTYKRLNIRVNLDMKITDWLKIGTQSYFTHSDRPGANPSIGGVISMPPFSPGYDKDGELLYQTDYGWSSSSNPLLALTKDVLNKNQHLSGTFYADIDIPFVKGLNYRLNIAQNQKTWRDYQFDYYARSKGGEGYKYNAYELNQSYDNILTYKRIFGKHSVNATLAYGSGISEEEHTKAIGRDFSDALLGYNRLDLGTAGQRGVETGAWRETLIYSMARLNYVYNNRYIFTGTWRRDGFSGFGKQNKFGSFPSAAVAWRVSEESFVKDKVSWLDELKLRLSFGDNGNRTVGRYQTLARADSRYGYLYGDGSDGELRLYATSLANDALKWETTRSFNYGLDFGLFSGRLSGYVDMYSSNTYDLLYNMNIPSMNNFGSITANIGKIANRGVELSITGVPVKTKDFSWTATFNYSINRNKVVSITGIKNKDGVEDDLISSNIFINKPYGVVYNYRITGMWQVQDYIDGKLPDGFNYGTYKVEDVSGEGEITPDKDRQILGYTDPSYRFSIQNTFQYKDFELKMFINSIQGGSEYYCAIDPSGAGGDMGRQNRMKFDYWTPENPNAFYQRLTNLPPVLTAMGTYPVQQRSFVRLQELTLSYTVPSSLLKAWKINRLKLYATGTNLLTITDWRGRDPETGDGYNSSNYPLMKNYTVGLNFEF